ECRTMHKTHRPRVLSNAGATVLPTGGLEDGQLHDAVDRAATIEVLHATHIALRDREEGSSACSVGRYRAGLTRTVVARRRVEAADGVRVDAAEPPRLEVAVAVDVEPVRVVRRAIRPATTVARILRRVAVDGHDDLVRERLARARRAGRG